MENNTSYSFLDASIIQRAKRLDVSIDNFIHFLLLRGNDFSEDIKLTDLESLVKWFDNHTAYDDKFDILFRSFKEFSFKYADIYMGFLEEPIYDPETLERLVREALEYPEFFGLS